MHALQRGEAALVLLRVDLAGREALGEASLTRTLTGEPAAPTDAEDDRGDDTDDDENQRIGNTTHQPPEPSQRPSAAAITISELNMGCLLCIG